MRSLSAFQRLFSFSEELEKAIILYAQKKSYKAGTIILEANQQNETLFFIEQGLARVYYYSENEEKEITTRFATEGDFLCSFDSFFSQQPSTEYIEILQTTQAYAIRHNDYNYLVNRFPEVKDAYFKVYERYLQEYSLWSKLILNPDYTTRYKEFIRTHPKIANKVQIQHLASYLGMCKYKLSHIRSELLRE